MEKEYIILKMVIDMKVNLKKIKKKEMGYYFIEKMMKIIEKNMKVILRKIKEKEKVNFIGMMVIGMKVILRKTKEKEKVNFIIIMGIGMKATIKMIK